MRREKSVASKTTMNLAMRERGAFRLEIILPVVLLIGALAALLGYAVANQLAQVHRAQREVNALRTQVERLESQLTDFDEVRGEYNHYTYKDYDRTITDRLEVMELMEREIFPTCYVQSFAVAARRLSLTLEGLTLEDTSDLIERLTADELVDKVEVETYNATSSTGTVYPVAVLNITLSDATARGEGKS